MHRQGSSGAKAPRVCPECGTDRFAQRRLEYERRELETLRAAANKIARENGRQHLELEKLRLEREDIQSRFQRKIVRQSKAITKLEEKLRAAGQRPYEGMERLDDAVGGADGEREPVDAVEKRRFA